MRFASGELLRYRRITAAFAFICGPLRFLRSVFLALLRARRRRRKRDFDCPASSGHSRTPCQRPCVGAHGRRPISHGLPEETWSSAPFPGEQAPAASRGWRAFARHDVAWSTDPNARRPEAVPRQDGGSVLNALRGASDAPAADWAGGGVAPAEVRHAARRHGAAALAAPGRWDAMAAALGPHGPAAGSAARRPAPGATRAEQPEPACGFVGQAVVARDRLAWVWRRCRAGKACGPAAQAAVARDRLGWVSQRFRPQSAHGPAGQEAAAAVGWCRCGGAACRCRHVRGRCGTLCRHVRCGR